MKKMRNNLIFYLFIGALSLIFFTRFHASLTRAFDPDEFSHMHWAWLVKSGQIPYRDFFFYNTPLYQYLMAPVFFLPEGAGIVLVVRLLTLFAFAALTALLYLTARETHLSVESALFAALIFSVFPMNFDKSIDVRPDIIMLGLYFAVVVIFLSRNISQRRLVVSGILLSSSGLIMPKIIFALPALIYLYILIKPKPFVKKTGILIAAALVTALIVFFPVIVSGTVPQMLQSIFADSVAVNIGKTPFSPWKALSPWPLVYVGAGGPSFPWYVNTSVWILALLGFVGYLIKFPKTGLFYLLYTATGLLFLFAFPAPYLQYFLPLSLVASVMTAYFISEVLPSMLAIIGLPFSRLAVVLPSLAVLLVSYTIQYRVRVSEGWNNTEQLTVLEDVARVVRPDERIYDMVGSYVFRPDAYFFCCHPYAEFIDKLGRVYPTLREAITGTGTKFVILDRTGMAFWQPKPDDLTFIERHFVESAYRKIYVAGQQFACFGGDCELLNVHSRGTGIYPKRLEIIVPETYEVITVPPDLTITLDSQIYEKEATLTAGNYQLTVPDNLERLIVRIKR